jgi:hypothetical protein
MGLLAAGLDDGRHVALAVPGVDVGLLHAQ